MTIQLDFWHLVGLLVAFFGACAGAGKLLLDQAQRHLDLRFVTLSGRLDGMEHVNREDAQQWQRVEREMLKFQADMPMKYVMRDDYIRGQSILEAKLDGLAGKLENAQLRAIIQQDKK